MTVRTGLRERKKAATREALSRAAVRLALEHGVAGVTVEAVAEAAGVSPRTFHNYFPGKEEAIVAPLLDGAHAWIDALAAQPPRQPVWEALRESVDGLLPAPEERAEFAALLRVVRREPGLVAHQLCGIDAVGRQAAELIAARTGTDADRDLYPNLLAGSVGLALHTALDLWATGHADADPAPLVDEAFARLRAGLVQPG